MKPNQFLKLWNEFAGKNNLSKAMVMSDSRSTSLKRLVAEIERKGFKSDEVINLAINNILKSSFLKGEAGEFRANIDFFLRKSRFWKLAEGGYNDIKKTKIDKYKEIANEQR